MDKDLQADIDKLSRLVRQVSECVGTYKILDERNYIFSPTEFIRLYEVSKGSVEALDRIVARIPEPSSKEDCVFKNCEWYDEDAEGHCNGECCDGSAQERCEWYKYLQKDREIRKPEPAPVLDEYISKITNEMGPKAFAEKYMASFEPKPAPDFDDNRDTSGDWPEDFPGENGQYECVCIKCRRHFVGHKRRVVCKICSSKPDFDAIAREIESNAYQSGTFFPALCAEILRKHFGKGD